MWIIFWLNQFVQTLFSREVIHAQTSQQHENKVIHLTFCVTRKSAEKQYIVKLKPFLQELHFQTDIVFSVFNTTFLLIYEVSFSKLHYIQMLM